MKKSFKVNLARWAILVLVGSYLLVPILAMLDFSTKPYGGGNQSRTMRAWKVIPQTRNLMDAISLSMSLAVLVILFTLLLVIPTLIWVHLKLPKLRRVMETICLIPLAIPAIVLVVGIAPLYRFISMHISESPLTLAGVYSMLILPYTYRSLSSSLDTTDIKTLYEAARTLGASTSRLMAEIIMPSVRAGIMNGAVISIALVLGEFTIASLLNFENLQVTVFRVGRSDGNVAVAVSVASLLFVLILLLLIPTTKREKKVLDVDLA